MLISFEGPDGVGKTTQIKLLREYLDGENIDNISLREPGGSQVGELIRTLVKSDESLSDRTRMFLFGASRSHLIETQIKPLLDSGTVVILDRFVDSTTIYQGTPDNHALYRHAQYLNEVSTGGLKPDITFLLDMDSDAAIERLKARNEALDVLDVVDLAVHRKLRNEFLLLAQAKDRIQVIDASQSPETVHNSILFLLNKDFKSMV